MLSTLDQETKTPTLNEQALSSFRAQLRGNIITRNDPTYNNDRKVYNGMIDKRPLLIVKCRDTADVMATVNFARNQNLVLAVRGGGHNGGGLGLCNDGLVLDLSLMKGIRVDPVNKTVRVEGGCLLGEMDHATHAFGMAVPCGINATTGVGGLALGGGVGYLSRKYGLTIDSLLEADVVLADGRFLTASANQNEDLFWAIRGGGGNFGVITSFLFRTHPVSTVYAGPMLWNLDESREVMEWYRDFMKHAPDDIYGFFAFLVVPPVAPFPVELQSKKMCGIVWCYTGALDDAEKAFKPIRGFKKPALDFVGPIPHPVLQSLFDALYPSGMQWYWKGDFVNELTDAAIDIHLQYGEQLPSMFSTMHLYPINGAAAQVGKHDTAWNNRDSTWAMVIAGIDPDPANKDVITQWAKNYWQDLHPLSAGGSYVNFMMDEGTDRVKATYGENYDRLVSIKKKYDPKNLFSVNQNIKP
ncbi:FAD-binding oxidoreductase [Chryseolinea lacunae]|uniref:FAD-binding oxidoreductase n=1 Tax=Chryseolinea lacunae TaxID=2801331 RepID=A0ABS1KXE4_9BACT|nr:FAD-binding oxidoreductase [Chryseolinea lacunae]MBL0744005.1 FAD-binding oxidoreductase [Chryseolinea lacunae]